MPTVPIWIGVGSLDRLSSAMLQVAFRGKVDGMFNGEQLSEGRELFGAKSLSLFCFVCVSVHWLNAPQIGMILLLSFLSAVLCAV